jgi:glutaredoxin
MSNKPKVKLYTLSTCPWCMRTKQFFKDKGIEFEFVDYDLASEKEQKKILKDIEKLGARSSFPLVIIDEYVIQGYDPEHYEKVLSKKK